MSFKLTDGTVPLSRIIQNLSFRYSKYINSQTKEIGHLFQGRYKAILVDEESYLLELSRYIHLNPVRSGLCKSHQFSEARAVAAFIVQHIEGITLTSLAKELGRDLSAVSQAAGRLQKRFKANKSLKERVEKVINVLEVHRSQALYL